MALATEKEILMAMVKYQVKAKEMAALLAPKGRASPKVGKREALKDLELGTLDLWLEVPSQEMEMVVPRWGLQEL